MKKKILLITTPVTSRAVRGVIISEFPAFHFADTKNTTKVWIFYIFIKEFFNSNISEI